MIDEYVADWLASWARRISRLDEAGWEAGAMRWYPEDRDDEG